MTELRARARVSQMEPPPKRKRKKCTICGKTIPRRLGLWAIYCSQRCADADGAES